MHEWLSRIELQFKISNNKRDIKLVLHIHAHTHTHTARRKRERERERERECARCLGTHI